MTLGWCPFIENIRGVHTYARDGFDPVGFCDHTASGYYSTLKSSAFWNGAGVSVHFSIAQDGSACQTVSIFDQAWAQGRLGPRVTWPPFEMMGRRNPNQYLISTEHEDKLEMNYRWSEAMYQTDLKIKRWCIEEVKRVTGKDLLRFGIDSLAGHYMFDDVNRRYCPGGWWQQEGRGLLWDGLHTQGELPLEDDMQQWDAWGMVDFKVPGGQTTTIDARRTFSLPPTAKRIHLEVLSKAGYAVIQNGNRTQAGRIGWARSGQIADGYEHMDVWLGEGGEFHVFAEDPNGAPEFFTAHVTAVG